MTTFSSGNSWSPHSHSRRAKIPSNLLPPSPPRSPNRVSPTFLSVGRRRPQSPGGRPPIATTQQTTFPPATATLTSPSKSWDDGDEPVPVPTKLLSPRWNNTDDDERSVSSDPVRFVGARSVEQRSRRPAAYIITPDDEEDNDDDHHHHTSQVDSSFDEMSAASNSSSIPLRMITAIQSNIAPPNMTRDERNLWEAMQEARHDWEAMHQHESRALQRVLADISDQRDQAVQRQCDCQEQWQHERMRYEQQQATLKEHLQHLQQQQQQQQQMQETNTTTPAPKDSSSPDNNLQALQRQLDDKTTALESAKMIITSLEHASGCLKTDLRQKLKHKEEELQRLQAQNTAKQKSLDSMAIELRQARRAQAAHNQARRERNARMQRLERNINQMRDAGVVLEATQDASAVTQLMAVLGDSIGVLKECCEEEDYSSSNHSCTEGGDDLSMYSTTTSSSSNNIKRRVDTMDDSNSKSLTMIRRLEEELKQVRDEQRKMLEKRSRQHEDELQAMQMELKQLQSQYKTNLAMLARKDRELGVLRDSLKVDDDEVGYISDDGDDFEDDDDTDTPTTSPPLDTYGPSQAAALATLLAQPGPSDGPQLASVLQCQLVQTHAEAERARKDLQTERVSLANAKMIISSLEKANKSMREDLRSRLHDSNSAIASLLEKSMGSEKTTAQLRNELEALRREKDEEREELQCEIERLRRGTSPTAASSWVEEKKDEMMMITETID